MVAGTDWIWKARSSPGLLSTSTDATWKRPPLSRATSAMTPTKEAV